MRFCLTALGTLGDVRPVVAVGRRLADAGHDVTLVTMADYARVVRSAGLATEPVQAPSSDLWPAAGWARRIALAQPGVLYAALRRGYARVGPAIAAALLAGAEGADLVVAGTATRKAVARLAASQGRPWATLLLAPLLPAGRPEAGVLVPPGFPPSAARAVSGTLWAMTTALGDGPARALAARLQAASGAAAPETVLVAASPVVSPPETALSDAPGRGAGVLPGRVAPVRVVPTGWIATAGQDAPPADPGLVTFLGGDRHAVAMSFGSCPSADPAADTRLLLAAARRVGRPVVLQDPALPSGPLGADAWNAPGVDHAWLHRRVAAVVHHGGAGTTMTALAAGCPAAVVPHLGDQPYYARRVAQLGVGVHAGRRPFLTAGRLASAVERTLDPAVAERAARVGDRVAAEDGAGAAVAAIEELAAG